LPGKGGASTWSNPVGVSFFSPRHCSHGPERKPIQSSDLALAQRQQAAALGRARIEENRKRRRELWQAEANVLWQQWRTDPLFIMGVGLYWGEGTKSTVARWLALTTTDVYMLRVWLRWCERFMPGVPLYFTLSVHDTCDVDAARAFWERELGIDVNAVCVAVS
jgi:hypothetical protein